jgi:O-Antigen ligase
VQGVPLALVFALVAFMVERDGAFAVTVWYPIGLAVLAVAVTLAVSARGQFAGLPRVTLAALACLAAFTVWGFATIVWASARGDAWDGSNETLLYVLVFAVLAGWRATSRALWPAILALASVVAVEGVVTVFQVLHAGDPSRFLIGSRLSEPLGYPNATGALFMILTWLCVGLASRPWLPAPARGLAFGLAGLNATLNLLTESRGSAYTLPAVAIVFLVLVPNRLRSLAALGLLGVAVVPVLLAVLHIHDGDPAVFIAAIRHALYVGLLLSVLLAGAGWLFAALDDRVNVSPQFMRRAGLAVVLAAVLAAAGSAAVVRPWDKLSSAWHSFKYGGESVGAASHFGGLGSNRYDFWRVGLIEFERHPVQGIGVDNFLVPYLQQRHSQEEPLFPHSLFIRLLSQTGLVGTALFAGFLALLVAAVLRIPPGPERDLAGILTVGGSVWILHGLVDWLWEMPALGVLGMALFGTACGLAPRGNVRAAIGRSWKLVLASAAGAATLVAAVSFALPWFAQRDIQQATADWRTDPAAAFSTLQSAHSLNFLDDQADVLAGAIASRLHRYPLMQARFQAAVKRSPDDWYANLELGIAASLTGRHALAASSLQRARQLDPGEEIVRSVTRTFEAGRRIDPDAVDREFEASQ